MGMNSAITHPSGMPFTPDQAAWARCRRVHQRTPIPTAGQQVWYRHRPHGPIVPTTVERVDVSNRADPNVWRMAAVDGAGRPVMVMVDDPWPEVLVRVDRQLMATREARLDGSPGWLPKGGV